MVVDEHAGDRRHGLTIGGRESPGIHIKDISGAPFRGINGREKPGGA